MKPDIVNSRKLLKPLEKAGITQEQYEKAFPNGLTGAQIQSCLLKGEKGFDGLQSRFPAQTGGKGFGRDASNSGRAKEVDTAAYRAIEQLRPRSAVFVDAMRQLRSFVEHARRQ